MLTQQEKLIRVVIVDDHALLRTGLRMIIERHPEMVVVGEAAGCAQALEMVAAERPEIILLDVMLGDDSGIDIIPELIASSGEGRVILLTGLLETETHRSAILAGALGLVLKGQTTETLLKAIEKVHAGEVWLDRTMIASILNQRAAGRSQPPKAEAAKIAALTEREREVIGLIGEGLQNKAIAERLVISESTVRHHLTSIFAKLGVTDRFELVVFAYIHGLASLPK